MAWIKVCQTLFSHDKTFYLAEQLDLPEVYAASHLISLWMHALDHWPDGRLPEMDRQIARAARWEGLPGPFVEALVVSGFIDDDTHGNRTIHDWHDYAGNMIKKRELNAERQRKFRARQPRKRP